MSCFCSDMKDYSKLYYSLKYLRRKLPVISKKKHQQKLQKHTQTNTKLSDFRQSFNYRIKIKSRYSLVWWHFVFKETDSKHDHKLLLSLLCKRNVHYIQLTISSVCKFSSFVIQRKTFLITCDKEIWSKK
jgi:hypothetical protein